MNKFELILSNGRAILIIDSLINIRKFIEARLHHCDEIRRSKRSI